MVFFCSARYWWGTENSFATVGAQRIACAQCIAPSLIGDNICEKNLNFGKILFTEDRKGNSAAHS
jgi:hypothetical protein